MDLDLIRQKVESLNKTGGSTDFKDMFWKPSVGKQTVRVVPSKYNEGIPFTELKFHYGIGNKTIASPENWGEKDPINELAKQLFSSKDKEDWKLAKKLISKTRVFAPVIVRGEEDKGVKLWQFGKQTYQDFLNLAIDEEVGDYTDVNKGRDIKLTTVGPEVTGTKYNSTSISPSMKQTPLSNDEDEINDWLENQPNPFETYKKYTFEEVKSFLEEFLSDDEDENEGSIIDEGENDDDDMGNIRNEDVPKASKRKKFDDLFNE